MLIGNVIGYVFASVETIEKNEKKFHVLKIKCPTGKQPDQKSTFIECYLNESQLKYALFAKQGDIMYLTGELLVSVYMSKTGEPKSKIGMFVKTQKIIHSKKEKSDEESNVVIKDEIDW